MKVVNESKKVASSTLPTRLSDAGKGRVWLWDRVTGKPKALYSVDATELLEKYPNRWSANPVSESQGQAEDAVIIEPEPLKPIEAKYSKEADDSEEVDSWPSKVFDDEDSKPNSSKSSNRSRSRKKVSN